MATTRARPTRWILAAISWFVALTAVGGGVAILTGLDTFPPEWLDRTPFASYTVPALLLIVVGLGALVAALTVLRRRRGGLVAAAIAGSLMAGYIVGESLLLPPPRTWIEGLYLALGLLLLGLAWTQWRAESPHRAAG